MKRLLPLTAALMLAAAPGFAQEERIVEVTPTTPIGTATVINGITYIAIGAGVLVLASLLAEEDGSSATGTN
ncbi:MAG: hypothetical protein ACSHXW_09060 [Yoonia sp.]